jgi:holo-[acyl-carrier protein] synthase
MIYGVGVDIIEVSRIDSNISKHGQKFLDKVFTLEEQTYCKTFRHSAKNFAGRFAAKEAIVKAFGTGISDGLTWLDIEILNDLKGKPYLVISDALKMRYENPIIQLSISHCNEYATAVAIWSKE